MTIPNLKKGRKRQWVKCKKCNNVAYYDYIPYSLSNPIRTAPCKHKFEEYKNISADEAITLIQ